MLGVGGVGCEGKEWDEEQVQAMTWSWSCLNWEVNSFCFVFFFKSVYMFWNWKLKVYKVFQKLVGWTMSLGVLVVWWGLSWEIGIELIAWLCNDFWSFVCFNSQSEGLAFFFFLVFGHFLCIFLEFINWLLYFFVFFVLFYLLYFYEINWIFPWWGKVL